MQRLLSTSLFHRGLSTSRTLAIMQFKDLPTAPKNEDEDVWSYPRPPRLERCPNHLVVTWVGANGDTTILADTDQALRVLETSHPPTYYLPLDSLKLPISQTSKSTFCEWKGSASYYSIRPDPSDPSIEIRDRIWGYLNPTPGFAPIKGYVSFYATSNKGAKEGGRWKCSVDGEPAMVQEGDFYGGWITKNIKGKMKGGPGTFGW